MEMADHKTFEWMTEDGDDITDDDTKVPEQPCVSLAANWYIHTGEWKKWTVYPGKTAAGQAETILGKTASALNRGENLWAWSSLAQNVWGVAGQEGVFRPTTYEMILLSYALSGQRLTLADGRSVEIVAVVHHPDESLYVENIGVKGGGAELAPTKLTLPKGMETIAARAFEGMSEVYEIRLPEGLKTIGSRAFADCPVLQAVYIPSSVTQIAADAFDGSETCIQTDRRNSEAARFAEAHDLNCIADDDPPVEEGENG